MANRELIIYEQRSRRTLLDIHKIGRFVGLHPDVVYEYCLSGLITYDCKSLQVARLFSQCRVHSVGYPLRGLPH
jgi:hypothetical protein